MKSDELILAEIAKIDEIIDALDETVHKATETSRKLRFKKMELLDTLARLTA